MSNAMVAMARAAEAKHRYRAGIQVAACVDAAVSEMIRKMFPIHVVNAGHRGTTRIGGALQQSDDARQWEPAATVAGATRPATPHDSASDMCSGHPSPGSDPVVLSDGTVIDAIDLRRLIAS